MQDPTVPESPAFALKNRIRVERKVETVRIPSTCWALSILPILTSMVFIHCLKFSRKSYLNSRRGLTWRSQVDCMLNGISLVMVTGG